MPPQLLTAISPAPHHALQLHHFAQSPPQLRVVLWQSVTFHPSAPLSVSQLQSNSSVVAASRYASRLHTVSRTAVQPIRVAEPSVERCCHRCRPAVSPSCGCLGGHCPSAPPAGRLGRRWQIRQSALHQLPAAASAALLPPLLLLFAAAASVAASAAEADTGAAATAGAAASPMSLLLLLPL